MALNCFFEHFEQDADSGFVREVARILRPGGKVCILPLYMNENYHVLSNFELIQRLGMPAFDKNVDIYMQERPNNHFGRFYDAKALKERVIDIAEKAGLKVEIIDCNFSYTSYGIGTNLALVLSK